MKLLFLFTLIITNVAAAQSKLPLQPGKTITNTAVNCLYMSAEEREMIHEINRARSQPANYIQYLLPLLKQAELQLLKNGKGDPEYSLTFSSSTIDGITQKATDTTWHYSNEEEVKALKTLIADLKKSKPLSILLPDSGIYRAAKKHEADQIANHWKLMHTGSDGSHPWDRIKSFSPAMVFGNENIGGRYGHASSTPRDMIIQLLIDSGIPGYGHRYNILNPHWTHIGCSIGKYNGMYWWIQNFGTKR